MDSPEANASNAAVGYADRIILEMITYNGRRERKMFSYFKPHTWEEHNRKSIYRYIGIKFFKKYLLLTHLMMFRWRGKKQLVNDRSGIAELLRNIEWQTRRDEVIHLVFIFLSVVIIWGKYGSISTTGWILFFIVNIYANVYPIFVQRYNRYRVLKLLTRMSN